MKTFALGIIFGSILTSTLTIAGTRFYDSKGQPSAPSGSIQQFDYFRERQQRLDIGKMRQLQEQQHYNPCAR